MKRSALFVGIGLFVVIGAIATGLTLVKRRMIHAAASAPSFEPPTAVTLAKVRTTSWQPTSDLVGTVFAIRSVTIQNEVEGVVRFVGYESGQIVEQGQVLVKLDDATVRAELNTAEASLQVAEAEVSVVDARVRLAEAEMQMQDAAAQSRATAAIEVVRARAELEKQKAEQIKARASVSEAKARVERVQTQLSKHTIRAPFRAQAGFRSVQEGQFLAQQVGSEGTPIATLQEVSDRIYIDFPVPQEHIGRVKMGMSVVGQREGAGSGEGAAGTLRLEVVAMDSTASNATRNVRVRTIVDNREQQLRPGMFVKLRVPIEDARAYVVVPVTAVRRASFSDQVFVIRDVQEPGPDGKPAPAMRAEQRFVRLGPTIGDDVIVVEGLKEGEQIATSGSFKLREGALVMRAVPPVPTTPAAASVVPGTSGDPANKGG